MRVFDTPICEGKFIEKQAVEQKLAFGVELVGEKFETNKYAGGRASKNVANRVPVMDTMPHRGNIAGWSECEEETQ